jgi:hypothetical protein
MSKPILTFKCAWCDERIKMFEVQGQHVEDRDRQSALGMKPHVCRVIKRRSQYELQTGVDVVDHP